MADIYLPTRPLPKLASVIPIVPGGWQGGFMGGEEVWAGLMGSRYSVKLETPNLKPEPDGREWTAAILDGLMGGVIVGCRFHQPGLRSRAFHPIGGAIVVDGADQAGSVVKLRGFQPRAVVAKREFFGLVTAGRSVLYRATAQTFADDDGKLSLPISPMLHVEPGDGDVCEFGKPMIEGKLTVDDGGYTNIPAKVQGMSLTITETR